MTTHSDRFARHLEALDAIGTPLVFAALIASVVVSWLATL